MIGLTVDDHGYVHKVDLPSGLHAGLAAVNALVRLGHLADLQVVVWQHLKPAFTGQEERRKQNNSSVRGRGDKFRKKNGISSPTQLACQSQLQLIYLITSKQINTSNYSSALLGLYLLCPEKIFISPHHN